MGNNVDGDARARKDIEKDSASGSLSPAVCNGEQSGWVPMAMLDINQQSKA